MTTTQDKPIVGKPGQGLPFLEWFIAKYFIFPSVYKKTSLEEAKTTFSNESKKIINLTSNLDNEKMSTRCLIERPRGLEDNSRYWSVGMAVEHLVIVGNGIGNMISELANGGTNRPTVKIEDVKPDPNSDPAKVISDFKEMSENFLKDIPLSELENFDHVTHDHPWFGPMNAKQWYILAGRHQGVHRHQIEKIIEKLG